VSVSGENGIIKIDGELRIGNAGALHQALRDSLDLHSDLRVDFSGVEECDTTALQLICALRKSAAKRGRCVRVLALSEAIRETARRLGLAITERAAEGDCGI